MIFGSLLFGDQDTKTLHWLMGCLGFQILTTKVNKHFQCNQLYTHTHVTKQCLLQFGSGSVVEEAMGVWHLRSNGCKAIYGFPFKMENYGEVGCLSVSEARIGSRFKCNISLLASSINRSCSYGLRWGSIAWCAEVGRGCICFRGLLEAAGKSLKKLHLSVICTPIISCNIPMIPKNHHLHICKVFPAIQ